MDFPCALLLLDGGPHTGHSHAVRDSPLMHACPSAIHMRSQQEDSYLCTRKQALARHQICWNLDLEFLRLQNCEKQMLFKPLSLWYFCYSSLNRQTTTVIIGQTLQPRLSEVGA